jgi:hypothetical protein
MTKKTKIVKVNDFILEEEMENISQIIFSLIEDIKINALSKEEIYKTLVDLIIALIEVEKSSLELKEISYICLVTERDQRQKTEDIEYLVRNSVALISAMLELKAIIDIELKQELKLKQEFKGYINMDQANLVPEIFRIINNVHKNHSNATLNFSRMMRNTGRANDNESN